MGVARAWSRWPTEKFSLSLMHTVNDYLSDVGSKKAVSFMVLEKNGPPIWYFFDHVPLSIYQSQNASVAPGAPLQSHYFP